MQGPNLCSPVIFYRQNGIQQISLTDAIGVLWL